MGNIFDKKQVWQEELHSIKTEIAAIDKRKFKLLNYEKAAKDVCFALSVSTLIIAVILVILSLYFEALGLVCSAAFFYGCRICMSNAFNLFVHYEEEKILKCRANKEKLINKIKNQVTYNEARSLLAGHDSEIDVANGAYLNLGPLTY